MKGGKTKNEAKRSKPASRSKRGVVVYTLNLSKTPDAKAGLVLE